MAQYCVTVFVSEYYSDCVTTPGVSNKTFEQRKVVFRADLGIDPHVV